MMTEDKDDFDNGLETEEEHELRLREEGPPEPSSTPFSINWGSRAKWILGQSTQIDRIDKQILFLQKDLKDFKQGYLKRNYEYDDDYQNKIELEIEYLEKVNKTSIDRPILPSTKQARPDKPFTTYFLHNKPGALAEAIKKAFENPKPTTLAVFIHTLQFELEQPLLIINSHGFQAFYREMVKYWDGVDIGTRQVYQQSKDMFRFKHADDILNCKAIINTILKSIDNQ